MFDEIPQIIDLLSGAERAELFRLLKLHKDQEAKKLAVTDFLAFTKLIWPDFVEGRHHRIMADKFEEIANGTLKRLIINIAPRHTKSMFGSFLLPAWFMGLFPDRKIIQSSHTADLALKFGRDVRNLVSNPKFHDIFPGIALQADSKAAGRWTTNRGGSYYAVGVGGAVAGYGGDLVIIDDPHSEQDGKSLNPEAFDSTYSWYMTGPRQRLQPGGAILIIMCMTGDTKVLLPSGIERPLRDIRPGDIVSTYEEGRIASAQVTNWKSNGVDTVYTVQTKSGRILRANERHPFLVDFNGERKWTRLHDLKPGMLLVATKAAPDRPNIYSVTLDEVISISLSGMAEVFDVEVDRTENFIANGVVSHNTRWSKRDLTGKLLDFAARNPESDQWEVIEFPAIMPSGNALWPEYWPIEQLLTTKATIHPRFWAAQYQQEPTSAETAMVKREWWKIWEEEDPPKMEYVIQSWDTAFTTKERNDFSACTTWGVFYIEDGKTGKKTPQVMLLDAFKEKMEFPELKAIAFKHYKEQNPDTLIVEAKASGMPLIQELRQTGIPVQEFVPSKGNDKIARVNAIADLFSAGVIWCPDTTWAREVIEEFADFPNGDHDDLVDSSTCALIRYRQGGFIRLPSDDYVEPKPHVRKAFY